ncbi:MAG: HAMP domain-containing histidine kinase [Lachnospiraceae bacterium]|nr:HAMP domain-containing histidine kinase [Lachnospiraceae bacterium]
MSNFRKIIILYTVLMMAALAVILNIFKGMDLSVKNVESYNEQELTVYKQVWDNVNEGFVVEKDTALKQVLILWGVILVLGYAFILLAFFLLVKPVKEMEEFASSIAKGNLDVPLPIHKNNMFGSFTESFDLMREELKASRQREIEAQKAKREMVAELSHDLKTPVATIQATCEVLELKVSKELEEAKKEVDWLKDSHIAQDEIKAQKKIDELNGYLEKISYISNKSETINQLVESVFHATLDDMEEVKIEPSENDSRLIEGFFNNLKEYGNIILDNHIPECLVYFDKLRMEQVIDNIVGNSYKYAGTDIHVFFDEINNSVGNNSKDNNFIRITICDEGPGVDEEELPLILEKYYRGKNTKEKQGYGLGLYLVNYYMEKQGGGMEYYNDNGFVVELLMKKV